MFLPDTNIWLALALSNHVFHDKARAWFADQKENDSVRFCRATQQSFLRLLTTLHVMQPYGLPAMSNIQAWETYDQFLSESRIAWTEEPRPVDIHWRKFALRGTASPKLWMDAYLAAFAIACKAQLVTTDKGFLQFAGLDVHLLTLKATT